MFVIKKIVRQTPIDIACTIERSTGEQSFIARFTQHAPDIRGVEFPELSTNAMKELVTCNEYRAFLAALFRFQDGETLSLPMVVRSDLVGTPPTP